MVEESVTLVGYYGAKSAEMEIFLKGLQGSLAQNPAFIPRPLNDIHTTISWIPPDFLSDSETIALMSAGDLPRRLEAPLSQLARIVQVREISLQFGGFNESDPMRSRGKSLQERSLSIIGDKAVLMGWPSQGGRATPELAEFRNLLLQAGIDHQYRELDGRMDADAYLVIGDVDSRSPEANNALSTAGQSWLSSHRLRRALEVDDLSLVIYRDRRLPEISCTKRALSGMLAPRPPR